MAEYKIPPHLLQPPDLSKLSPEEMPKNTHEYLKLVMAQAPPPDLQHVVEARELDAFIERGPMTASEFSEAVLNSPDFRRYIVSGLKLGELPAAVVCKLMDYGWGKPVERLEVRDTTEQLDALTPDEITQRLERVQYLLLLVKSGHATGASH